jgi:hypothetical protein
LFSSIRQRKITRRPLNPGKSNLTHSVSIGRGLSHCSRRAGGLVLLRRRKVGSHIGRARNLEILAQEVPLPPLPRSALPHHGARRRTVISRLFREHPVGKRVSMQLWTATCATDKGGIRSMKFASRSVDEARRPVTRCQYWKASEVEMASPTRHWPGNAISSLINPESSARMMAYGCISGFLKRNR